MPATAIPRKPPRPAGRLRRRLARVTAVIAGDPPAPAGRGPGADAPKASAPSSAAEILRERARTECE